MIKLVYWACVAIDLGVVLLFFALGLAAAGSARSSTTMVVLLLLVLPAMLLAASIVVFLRSSSVAWRSLAFVLVALPIVTAVTAQAYNVSRIRSHSTAAGELTFFKPGPERDLVDAIRRNDTTSVARALRSANVNAVGMDDMTPLVAALRQLRTATTDLSVLTLLLGAGANPNTGTAFEMPLEMALQVVPRVSTDAITMLLKAGANPSLKNGSGTPIFFSSVGANTPLEVLPLLLAHGADLRATSKAGETVLIYAATARNWRAAYVLLTQGADWTQGRSFKGRTFRELVDAAAQEQKERSGPPLDAPQADALSNVVTFLRSK